MPKRELGPLRDWVEVAREEVSISYLGLCNSKHHVKKEFLHATAQLR